MVRQRGALYLVLLASFAQSSCKPARTELNSEISASTIDPSLPDAYNERRKLLNAADLEDKVRLSLTDQEDPLICTWEIWKAKTSRNAAALQGRTVFSCSYTRLSTTKSSPDCRAEFWVFSSGKKVIDISALDVSNTYETKKLFGAGANSIPATPAGFVAWLTANYFENCRATFGIKPGTTIYEGSMLPGAKIIDTLTFNQGNRLYRRHDVKSLVSLRLDKVLQIAKEHDRSVWN